MGMFWQWDNLESYTAALVYSLIFYAVLYASLYSSLAVETTGFLCQVFDAFVALPQLIKNARTKSVKNLR